MHVFEKIAGLMAVRTGASGQFRLHSGKASLDFVQKIVVQQSGEIGATNRTVPLAHRALHGVIEVGHAGPSAGSTAPEHQATADYTAVRQNQQ
jgi:hypothetical protein